MVSFFVYSLNSFSNKVNLKRSESKITSLSINQNGNWLSFRSKFNSQLIVWEWKSESCLEGKILKAKNYIDSSFII